MDKILCGQCKYYDGDKCHLNPYRIIAKNPTESCNEAEERTIIDKIELWFDNSDPLKVAVIGVFLLCVLATIVLVSGSGAIACLVVSLIKAISLQASAILYLFLVPVLSFVAIIAGAAMRFILEKLDI